MNKHSNDDEFIKRGEIRTAAHMIFNALMRTDFTTLTPQSVDEMVDGVKPVKPPMTAVEYDNTRRRMCKKYGRCSAACPLYRINAGCRWDEPISESAQDIVETWALTHPE